MNAKVTTATITQTANEALGTAEKQLHYLIIETANGKHVINVGEKTKQAVEKITTQPKTETPASNTPTTTPNRRK